MGDFLLSTCLQGPNRGPIDKLNFFNATAFKKAKIEYNFGLLSAIGINQAEFPNFATYP